MGRVVLKNARLIPGDGPPSSGVTVVLKGERIDQVVAAEVETGEGDRVVDLGGRTVMPGLITCHHHPGYHQIGSYALPVGFEKPPMYLGLAGGKNMEALLDCGFTGAVGAGNGFAMDASLKMACDEGLIRGPRFVPCGRGLGTTGFSLDFQQPWYWKAEQIDVRTCDGADEFRKAVREEIREGAEMIKLYSTGGHLSVTPGTQFEMNREELAAAIEAAHSHGARIRSHASHPRAVMEAIELGIDVVDHADFLDAAGIEAMVKSRVFFVPSLRLAIESVRAGWSQGKPGEMEAESEYMQKMVPAAHEAGVRMVLGDDYGVLVLQHGTQNRELSFYVNEVGIPPLDVIRWGTINGAELMGRSDDLGTIEAGKLADLLVVDGDPLADMSIMDDTENLLAIVKGGAFMKDELASIVDMRLGRQAMGELA